MQATQILSSLRRRRAFHVILALLYLLPTSLGANPTRRCVALRLGWVRICESQPREGGCNGSPIAPTKYTLAYRTREGGALRHGSLPPGPHTQAADCNGRPGFAHPTNKRFTLRCGGAGRGGAAARGRGRVQGRAQGGHHRTAPGEGEVRFIGLGITAAISWLQLGVERVRSDSVSMVASR